MIRLGGLEAPLGAAALRATLAVLGATYRVHVAGTDRLEGRSAPVVITFWHEQLLVLGPLLRDLCIVRGTPISMLASRSRDGELGARIAARWGAHVVRGSSSRGGTEGLRALYRAARRDGHSPVVVPDGPRGPARQAKPGVVVLAQMARLPIVPIACATTRTWRLGSWDRMLVPKPFAHIEVVVGEPIAVPPELDGDGLAAWQARIAREIGGVGEAAQAAC